jgi:hypothetical protein
MLLAPHSSDLQSDESFTNKNGQCIYAQPKKINKKFLHLCQRDGLCSFSDSMMA